MRRKLSFVFAIVFLASMCSQGETRRKVILDHDGRGPATTDQQSMLLVLQSPGVETLGITIVSGDQWRDEEVAHTLRMLELTGHSDIKVYPGAVFPLINSKEEIKRWEKLYGTVTYQGAWNEHEGGDVSVIDDPSRLPSADHRVDVASLSAGYVTEILCEQSGRLA